jgi:ABC-type phosphate transport system permease subunit
MVLQAVVGDEQLLPSLPDTPLTYRVLLAKAFRPRVRNRATVNRLMHIGFCLFIIIFLLFVSLKTTIWRKMTQPLNWFELEVG